MSLTNNLNSPLDIGSATIPSDINSGITRKLGLRSAQIIGVNSDKNTIDVQWLGQIGGMNGIEISSPFLGLRSGMRFVPEVGGVVIIGFAESRPIILTYLLPAKYSVLKDSPKDNTGKATRLREINPGEMYLNSTEDAEIFLGKTIEIRDKNYNSIQIDPYDGSINLDSSNLYIDNEAGRISMGQILRNVGTSVKVITADGEPVRSVSGGNGLTELTIKVKEFSDATILNTNIPSPDIMQITLGTLVSTGGLKVVNQAGNEIVCDIRLQSGARIQIDKKGNYNINDGNMLKPADEKPEVNDLSVNGSNASYSGYSQQRAAREGDRVSIPMGLVSKNDEAHPNMNNKVIFNVKQLQLLASMFMSPTGPCTFTPTQTDVHLLGEITQGANGVFVGSLDKVAEANEYKADE
jgi:hypothetical protein